MSCALIGSDRLCAEVVICCPMHKKEIGRSKKKGNGFDHGWYCPNCRRHLYFNEDDFDKYLTLGVFKYIK